MIRWKLWHVKRHDTWKLIENTENTERSERTLQIKAHVSALMFSAQNWHGNDVNNVNYTLPMETASHRIKLTPYRLGLSPAMRMHTKFLLSHTRSRWHLYSIKSSLKTWRFTRITMSYINPPTPLWRWRRAYCGATATLNAQWHLSIQQSLYQL